MATEDTIQNLIRLDRLYFRALRSSYAKTTFYMNRKELLVLGISTVKELKLFDEGSWGAHVSRVKWNQQEAGKAGVFYRTDLLRMAKAGDLEHIPGKAEVDKVYFKTACPLLILSIRERLQELRISVESGISAKILAMCEWPGRDIIDSINLNAQDTDVLMKIKRIEEKYLSCFRMLKRVIQERQPNQTILAMTVPDETMQEIDLPEPPAGTGQGNKVVEKPNKEAIQAYHILGTLGCTQTKAAEIMTGKLKRPIAQGQVSRWNTQCENFLKANDLEGFSSAPKSDTVAVDPAILDMGARTDGKRTGDPRHKTLVDHDNAAYDE